MSENEIKYCCIIGDPIDHSLSPLIHNAAYRRINIHNEYQYFARKVSRVELSDVMRDFKKMNVVGVSITQPHKVAIMGHLTQISKSAEKIGAVNTLILKGGEFFGTNTDYLGIIKPIQKLREIEGSKIAILGAGGAARAALYGLTTRGAECTVFNRTLRRAEELKNEFNIEARPLSDAFKINEFDVVINCTYLGMNPLDIMPIPNPVFDSQQIVFDCVYNTGTTPFLHSAQAQGAKTIRGIEMFVEQAAEQFKLYTGSEISADFFRTFLDKRSEGLTVTGN